MFIPDVWDKILKSDYQDRFVDINSVNEEMTISQVVRFFERQGVQFTKTMIQNYVRVGVLPQPAGKRYYTKNHLIVLSLIHNLKTIYSLDEIKCVLEPIFKDTETFEDDIIQVTEIYEIYKKMHKYIDIHAKESVDRFIGYIDTISDEKYNTNQNEVFEFLFKLMLMALSIHMKGLFTEINEKTKNHK